MSINKDQVQGRIDQGKGAVKETAGKVIGNPGLQVRGNIEKNLGKAQAKVGDLKEQVRKQP